MAVLRVSVRHHRGRSSEKGGCPDAINACRAKVQSRRKINVKSIIAKIHTFWQAFFSEQAFLNIGMHGRGVGEQFQADWMNRFSPGLRKNGARHNCQTSTNTINFYHAAVPQTPRCFRVYDGEGVCVSEIDRQLIGFRTSNHVSCVCARRLH